MVECNLAKVDVEGSNPFSRSATKKGPHESEGPFLVAEAGSGQGSNPRVEGGAPAALGSPCGRPRIP